MRNALRIIRSEHSSLAAVLHALQQLARMALDRAVRPDFEVFRAMLYYIDAFPERQHHPKEDRYLFARLAEREPAARALIEVLRAEHASGAMLVRELEQLLIAFEQVWPQGAEPFYDAVQGYARFHWDHMRKEERELLPLAERALTEEDWQALDEAFAPNVDPLAGTGKGASFDEVYERIVRLAPAPVGLGARWPSAARKEKAAAADKP